MAKKSRSPFYDLSFLKKTSLTSLIAFLLYTLFKVAEPVIMPQASVELPASDQPVQIYSNQTGDDLTQLFTQSIRSGKKSITMVIFALLDPQVIRALNDKSEEGVSVYIVCDAKASPGITKKLPKAEIVRRAGKGLTHQKILVIDDNKIIIGSSNLTTDSLRTHGNLVIGIENPALAQALSAKIKSMDEGGGSTPLTHRQATVGAQTVELWVLPDDPSAVKRMIELFRSATKSVKVAMFTWTRIDFTEELIQASKRGVKVEVVLDRYTGKGASAKIVRMLSEAGISVRLSTGKGLLHHKFAYIDDTTLVNGSANWTNSAFKVNDDCFIVLYPLTLKQQEKMNRLWQVIQTESEKPGALSSDTVKTKYRKAKVKKKAPHYPWDHEM